MPLTRGRSIDLALAATAATPLPAEDSTHAGGGRSMRAVLSPATAAALVPDGATVMMGGFMGVGSPHRVINALVARGAQRLTVVANDTARPGVGIGKLIAAGCVAKVVASHIGTNQEPQRLMLAGELTVNWCRKARLRSGSGPGAPAWVACSPRP